MSQKTEQPLEIVTASFLLSEFRKDIRTIEAKIDTKIDTQNAKIDAQNAKIDAQNAKIDAKIDAQNAKIDSHFKWTAGIQIATMLAIVGTLLGTLLPLVLAK